MNRKIFLSVMVIVLVLAFTAVATFAYFSGTENLPKSATITTASISLGETTGFALDFSNLLPGESAVKEFSVKNIGTRAADFYFQLVGNEFDKEESNYMNFCLGTLETEAIHVWVQELDGHGGAVVNTWVNNTSVCNLYPGHPDSIISKIGDDVGVSTRVYYKVTVQLNPLAGNAYNGKFNTDDVNLIAVQYDGPGPLPDKDSFYSAWPVDLPLDDDPNYP